MGLPLGHNQAIECITHYGFEKFPPGQQHGPAWQSTCPRVAWCSLFPKGWACVCLIWIPFFATENKSQVSTIILLILAPVTSWSSTVNLSNCLLPWPANCHCVFTRRRFVGSHRVSEVWVDMPSRSPQSHGGVYSLWNCLFQLPGNTQYSDL